MAVGAAVAVGSGVAVGGGVSVGTGVVSVGAGGLASRLRGCGRRLGRDVRAFDSGCWLSRHSWRVHYCRLGWTRLPGAEAVSVA